MTWHARVDPEKFLRGLEINVVEHGPTHSRALDFSGVTSVVQVAGEAPSAEPTFGGLMLEEAAARALYEALARHFGGHPETASLRKDYEHERQRVDKFIAHLTAI